MRRNRRRDKSAGRVDCDCDCSLNFRRRTRICWRSPCALGRGRHVARDSILVVNYFPGNRPVNQVINPISPRKGPYRVDSPVPLR